MAESRTPCRPSLGTGGEQVEIFRLQADVIRIQHLLHFCWRQGQVGRAQFVHLATEPVPVQGQQGIAASGQHETQALGPAYQPVQSLQDFGVVENVRIVDGHDELRCLVRHIGQ